MVMLAITALCTYTYSSYIYLMRYSIAYCGLHPTIGCTRYKVVTNDVTNLDLFLIEQCIVYGFNFSIILLCHSTLHGIT